MRFMHEQPDGGVTIYHAASKENLEQVLGPMSLENYMAHVIGKSLPEGVKQVYVLADNWKPPESRHFRNAWQISEDGQISVCMDKARGIQCDRIRSEREEHFKRLDIDALRALSAQDAASIERVELEKRKLRDATRHPKLVNSATPEELAAIKLADLI